MSNNFVLNIKKYITQCNSVGQSEEWAVNSIGFYPSNLSMHLVRILAFDALSFPVFVDKRNLLLFLFLFYCNFIVFCSSIFIERYKYCVILSFVRRIACIFGQTHINLVLLINPRKMLTSLEKEGENRNRENCYCFDQVFTLNSKSSNVSWCLTFNLRFFAGNRWR